MSGTYRHGRTYCQVCGCRRRVSRAVEIELPTDWQPTLGFRVVTVTIGVCRDCGRLLERLVAALHEARVEHADLLAIIADAVESETAQPAQGEPEAAHNANSPRPGSLPRPAA